MVAEAADSFEGSIQFAMGAATAAEEGRSGCGAVTMLSSLVIAFRLALLAEAFSMDTSLRITALDDPDLVGVWDSFNGLTATSLEEQR